MTQVDMVRAFFWLPRCGSERVVRQILSKIFYEATTPDRPTQIQDETAHGARDENALREARNLLRKRNSKSHRRPHWRLRP
jgi:hypothetical protein